MKSYKLATVYCGHCSEQGRDFSEKLGVVVRNHAEPIGWRVMWVRYDRRWDREQRQAGDPSPPAPSGTTLAEDRNPDFVPRQQRLRVDCKVHGRGSVSVRDVIGKRGNVVLEFVKATA